MRLPSGAKRVPIGPRRPPGRASPPPLPRRRERRSRPRQHAATGGRRRPRSWRGSSRSPPARRWRCSTPAPCGPRGRSPPSDPSADQHLAHEVSLPAAGGRARRAGSRMGNRLVAATASESRRREGQRGAGGETRRDEARRRRVVGAARRPPPSSQRPLRQWTGRPAGEQAPRGRRPPAPPRRGRQDVEGPGRGEVPHPRGCRSRWRGQPRAVGEKGAAHGPPWPRDTAPACRRRRSQGDLRPCPPARVLRRGRRPR
jgi:hypothetical protein